MEKHQSIFFSDSIFLIRDLFHAFHITNDRIFKNSLFKRKYINFKKIIIFTVF